MAPKSGPAAINIIFRNANIERVTTVYIHWREVEDATGTWIKGTFDQVEMCDDNGIDVTLKGDYDPDWNVFLQTSKYKHQGHLFAESQTKTLPCDPEKPWWSLVDDDDDELSTIAER
jgi:hypothetical protein